MSFVRPHFSKKHKTKFASENSDEHCWWHCESGQGDHWWQLSCTCFRLAFWRKRLLKMMLRGPRALPWVLRTPRHSRRSCKLWNDPQQPILLHPHAQLIITRSPHSSTPSPGTRPTSVCQDQRPCELRHLRQERRPDRHLRQNQFLLLPRLSKL